MPSKNTGMGGFILWDTARLVLYIIICKTRKPGNRPGSYMVFIMPGSDEFPLPGYVSLLFNEFFPLPVIQPD